MPKKNQRLTDEEIAKTLESIPSGSSSEGEDSDADVDFVETGNNDEPISSDSDMDVVEDNENERNSSNKGNLPRWKKNYSMKPASEFSKSFGVPDQLKTMDDPTPLKIFHELFSKEIIEHIVFQTNLYAQQSEKKYIATSDKEIKTFLAINLLMGIKKSPSYRDYWSSDPKLKDPFISNLMSRHRFDWILFNLHLNNNVLMPNRNSPDYDRLYRVRPFIDMILGNFKKCYLPGEFLAVDESMVKFKGRCRGYKIWVLADKNGYFLNGDIYTGKSEEGVTKDLGGSVVRKLTNDLQGGAHKIFFDNYFTSYDLIKDLKDQSLDSCGTVRKNREKFPTQLKGDQSMKRGDLDWSISEDGIAAIKWKDKRVVNMASSYHDPRPVVQVVRKQKNGQSIEINCPVAVRNYNSNMNCVDKFDQMKKVYEIDRKSHKWWHRIFFYFLDATIVNAFIIAKELMSYQECMKSFRLEIVDGLVAASYTQKRKSTGPTIKVSKYKPHIPVEVRKYESAHQPRRGSRRRCALCSTKAKQIRTDWGCSICNVPLCLGKQKDCFQNYHK